MENLVQAANQSQKNIYLLIEGGAFAEQTIEPFQQKHTRSLYSLYQHPQLIEAKWVGPWLYQVKNNADLAAEMAQFQQVATVIFSSLALKPLAMQLAWGCTFSKTRSRNDSEPVLYSCGDASVSPLPERRLALLPVFGHNHVVAPDIVGLATDRYRY
ncbi:DUF4123 domain-containing protein [Providencia vermicola]|uniref:DUF4123 domain-containing protein n=1 Tax=Providencia vermicola TaxID=333965 RepID=UPI0034DD559F